MATSARSFRRLTSGLALLLLTGVLLLILTIILTYGYLNRRTQLEAAAFASAETQASAAAATINDAFAQLVEIGERVAGDLGSGAQPYDALEARLRQEAAANPQIDGLAVTFAPYAYSPDERLYQIYIYRTEAGSFDILEGATYDYTLPQGDDPTLPNTDWFRLPLERGAMWNPPFFAAGAQKVLVEYALPFPPLDRGPGDAPAGVVTVDYSLQDTRDLLARLELGATGYGFLVTDEGRLLAHPNADLVLNRSIFDLADMLESTPLREAAETALAGRSASAALTDPLTGELSWVFIEPLAVSGGALGVVLNQSEFAPPAEISLREQMTIFLAASGALMAIFGAALRADLGGTRSLWTLSIAFTLVCVGLIIAVWSTAPRLVPDDGTRLADPASLDRYLERYRQSLTGELLYAEIPTGLLIETIDFPTPTTVSISGYIWQRYADSLPDGIKRGFTLPQRTGTEAILEEVERRRDNSGETVVWFVSAVLLQDFDPQRFPLDSRHMMIRLSPADLTNNVVLTPDLNGYALIAPSSLPGIDSELRVVNWIMRSSSFSLRSVRYDTNFGLGANAESSTIPELTYQVSMQRQFLGPFIAYVLPASVVALLLFAFLLVRHAPGEESGIISTLEIGAALFFVLVVMHTALRDSIAAVGLTYLEYLYLVLYLAIISVALHIFLLTRLPNIPVMTAIVDRIPRLLYLPAITGVMLIVTLLIFVY